MSSQGSSSPLTRICSRSVHATGESTLWQTRCWLEHAVIGLNLCPFARAVHHLDRLWFSLSHATDADKLLNDLSVALTDLRESDPTSVESTLLIHPNVLTDFDCYNDFLGIADQLLLSMGLTGTVQLASFHPHYRFAGEARDSVSNNSNRSPFPMLHLLREASVSRAVDAYPDTAGIGQTNQRVLTELGKAGWTNLSRRWDRL